MTTRPITIGRPILSSAVMLPVSLFSTFEPTDEEKELWQLEQETCQDVRPRFLISLIS